MKNTEDTEEDMDTGEVTHEADSSNLELEEEKTKTNDYADLSEYKFSFSKRSAFLHSRSETRLRKADDGKSFHTIDICIPIYVEST